MTDAPPLRCKCRRQAITSLRCARCSVPICPDCSKPAPVGMLCRECVSGKKTRLFQVSAGSLAAAYAACLAVAAFGGWLLADIAHWGLFALWGGFLYGLAVAEVGLRVTGRKRGAQMEILVGSCSVVGIVAGWILNGLRGEEFDLILILIRHLTDPWTYALIFLAVFASVSRIRNI